MSKIVTKIKDTLGRLLHRKIGGAPVTGVDKGATQCVF